MDNTGVNNELEAFEAIEAAKDDELSFYALCEYFEFVMYDSNLEGVLIRQFRNKGNNLYLGAGEPLFNIIKKNTQTPREAWSDVIGAMTGGGNRLLLPFATSGMPASVGRKIHGLLSVHKTAEQAQPSPETKIVVCINDQLHFSIKGSEYRPFYKPRKGCEPYKILKILVDRYKSKIEPISGGLLSKEIYGNVTKANQVASSIDTLRDTQFATKLGHEFISNSSGYYLNDDVFVIEVE